jgi:hypothetical protein
MNSSAISRHGRIKLDCAADDRRQCDRGGYAGQSHEEFRRSDGVVFFLVDAGNECRDK